MASKRETEVISFLSPAEREVMDRYAKRVKAARDVAIKRRKAEMAFWKKVDEREDEVFEHIRQRREQQADGATSYN